MAIQDDYTAVANALLHFFLSEENNLPGWERSFIPQDRIPGAAGACAKVAVDALDAHRTARSQA